VTIVNGKVTAQTGLFIAYFAVTAGLDPVVRAERPHGLPDQARLWRAVAEIAWTACQRLDALQDAWRSLCKIAARAK
jgi:hypothetical protein